MAAPSIWIAPNPTGFSFKTPWKSLLTATNLSHPEQDLYGKSLDVGANLQLRIWPISLEDMPGVACDVVWSLEAAQMRAEQSFDANKNLPVSTAK